MNLLCLILGHKKTKAKYRELSKIVFAIDFGCERCMKVLDTFYYDRRRVKTG